MRRHPRRGKMAPKSSNGFAHEERIQRLEDHVAELRTSHAEVSTNLRNLGEQMHEGVSRIADKIDAVVKPVADTLHEHIKEDAIAKERLNGLDRTVSRMDEERQAREGRAKAIRTAIYAICTGAG